MKKNLLLTIFLLYSFSNVAYSNNNLYEKIDLFGEVLENIKKDYVDDVDQGEMMNSAINGVLQSLDPYSAYMSPELSRNANRYQGRIWGARYRNWNGVWRCKSDISD